MGRIRDKFVCPCCERGIIGKESHFLPNIGEVCTDCLIQKRRENAERVRSLSPGNRFRLMAGAPILPQ